MHVVEQTSAAGFDAPALTAAQEAAVAKLRYMAGQPGTIAVLCGPSGVGKTTVLGCVGAGISCLVVRLSPGEPCTPAAVASREACEPPCPSLLLVDDADRVPAAVLRGFLDDRRRDDGGRVIVLAGTGRLLTMLAGDPALEGAVRLRIVVPVLSLAETARVVASRWPAAAAEGGHTSLIRTIHEIAGGVAAAVIRLADVAAMLHAAGPDRPITAEDIETIHRRLSPHAA